MCVCSIASGGRWEGVEARGGALLFFPESSPTHPTRCYQHTLVYKRVTRFSLAHHLWTSLYILDCSLISFGDDGKRLWTSFPVCWFCRCLMDSTNQQICNVRWRAIVNSVVFRFKSDVNLHCPPSFHLLLIRLHPLPRIRHFMVPLTLVAAADRLTAKQRKRERHKTHNLTSC